MFSRRSFFRRAAAIVAAVALAPEIAFGKRFDLRDLADELYALKMAEPMGPYWLQTSLIHRYQSDAYQEWRDTVMRDALIKLPKPS